MISPTRRWFLASIVAGSFLCIAWGQLHVAEAAGAAPAGVSGSVFFDKNGNGRQDAEEPGFAGVGVVLFGRRGDGRPIYLTTRTDERGRYFFAGDRVGLGTSFRVTTGGAPLAYAVPTKYAAARTFYVATDGDDAHAGDREHPWRTIAKAVPLLQAGDVLYLRQGEYREYVTSADRAIAAGTGWDRPVVVAGAPGETVYIRPSSREGSDALISLAGGRQQYIVFDNLVLDAEDVTQPFKSQTRDAKGPQPGHIRVINCELLHAKAHAAEIAGDDNQFVNCRVHDNGHSSDDDGLSVSGARNLIQGCDIYFNAGSGIHLFNGADHTRASDNIVRGNRVHDNGLSGAAVTFGIGLHTGSKCLVYDNVIWSNPIGIVVSSLGAEESIFNNTVFNNRLPGIAISPDEETHANVVRNNIVINNRDPNIDCKSHSTVVDHNFTGGSPVFRDADDLDFHLQSNSPAIGAGIAVAAVQSDLDGIVRPADKPGCQGAYEFSATSFVPTARQYPFVFTAGKTYKNDLGYASGPLSSVERPRP